MALLTKASQYHRDDIVVFTKRVRLDGGTLVGNVRQYYLRIIVGRVLSRNAHPTYITKDLASRDILPYREEDCFHHIKTSSGSEHLFVLSHYEVLGKMRGEVDGEDKYSLGIDLRNICKTHHKYLFQLNLGK